jgi:hypothetical protein
MTARLWKKAVLPHFKELYHPNVLMERMRKAKKIPPSMPVV